MTSRQFTVLQVSSFKIDIPKTLGNHDLWDDAITQVFGVGDRKNTIILESCTDTQQHHVFWFNEDGLVVSVDHLCNDDYCKYDDTESLNR